MAKRSDTDRAIADLDERIHALEIARDVLINIRDAKLKLKKPRAKAAEKTP